MARHEAHEHNAAQYTEKFGYKLISDSQKIWRYVDFHKFESMLTSNTLYFSRIDSFTDRFEGNWTRANLETKLFISDSKRSVDQYDADRRIRQAAVSDILKLIYVTSFTIRDDESQLMWDKFTTTSNSVAIQTRFKKLKNSFCEYPFDNRVFSEVYASQIHYLQSEDDFIDEWSVLSPILYKRKKFENESEFRLFVTYPGIDIVIRQIVIEDLINSGKTSIYDFLNFEILPAYPYVTISINPKILLEKVVVHPGANDNFYNHVKTLMRNKGLEITPNYSSIKK